MDRLGRPEGALEVRENAEIGAREPVDGLPVVSDSQQVRAGSGRECPDEACPGVAGVLELVDQDQLVVGQAAVLV